MKLIANGTLVNPKTNQMEKMDVLIENGKIVEVAKQIKPCSETTVIDATGLIVAPGFIDLHVHLREPGFEDKETIFTGTRACAKGGYTTVVCMPNTKPALDHVSTLEKLNDIINRDAVIGVYPVAAITVGIMGVELTDHDALFTKGAVALSDDGRTTMNETFMIEALIASKRWNRPVMTHSEDHELTSGYKDEVYPTIAESRIVCRDIELCEQTNGILHVSHVSTQAAIEAIKKAKQKGITVTAEAAPHHFALNDEQVNVYDPLSKVNPPIRSEADRSAVVQAIKDGVIEAIATDHAPHEMSTKSKAYAEASFGISGIESAFSVSYQTLVVNEGLPLMKLIQMLTENPARIGRFNSIGSVEPNFDANIVLIDLNQDVKIDSKTFISKGKNTPFNGFAGKGVVVKTLYQGNVVYEFKENQEYEVNVC